MNILLTGSTGFIGSHILARLDQQKHNITVCVRGVTSQQTQYSHVNFVLIDFLKATSIEDWMPFLENIDVVINAVGIIGETKTQTFSVLHTDAPTSLFSAAEKSGVKRIIQISALGVDNKAKSQYHLSKLAADDVLASLNLDWFILRPSLVYGEGAKSMALFRAMAALPITPLIEGGIQKVQPIYIDDLVDTVVRCLDKDVEPKKVIDVVGPEEISMKNLLFKQRKWLGLSKTKTFSTPLKWMLRLVPFTRWLNEPALSAESLKMLQRGNVADVSGLTLFLNKEPQSMDSILEKNIATSTNRKEARLYFMPALLRLFGYVSLFVLLLLLLTLFFIFLF